MNPPGVVTADPDATFLAERLVDRDDVMATILEESLASGEAGQLTESGRTACGAGWDIRPPVERFPTSVQLADCPVSWAGIWHTHPTERGLREPEHSLPDWANVLYADVGASVVVGTVTSEVLVAPEDREAAIETFQNALGLDAASPREVVDAVHEGRIRDPAATRQRVREQLPELVYRVETPFPELEARMADLAIPAAAPESDLPSEAAVCGCYGNVGTVEGHTHAEPPRPRAGALHRRAEQCPSIGARATEGVNVREIVIGTVIGNIVGTLTNRYILGG